MSRAHIRRYTSGRAISSRAIGDSSCLSRNTCRWPTLNSQSKPCRVLIAVLSSWCPTVNYMFGHLRDRFNTICTPGEIVTGYAHLTESQRALADILVLSRAQRIVGPRASAFSQLAAHLAGQAIHSVDSLMVEDAALCCLRDGIARAEGYVKRSNVLRALLARDICWFLDVFSDKLPLCEQVALARQATRLEPDFCGSLNRLAAALRWPAIDARRRRRQCGRSAPQPWRIGMPIHWSRVWRRSYQRMCSHFALAGTTDCGYGNGLA